MLEKLKSAISIHKTEAGDSNTAEQILQQSSSSNVAVATEFRQIFPYEEKISAARLPRRELNGLTFTQNVGVFPRQVALEIRHRHATLGLNDVAHQRRHTYDIMPPSSCHVQQPKGVLSLGLPPNMIPKGFAAGTSKQAQQHHRQQSATSEVIHHYYETLSPKYANIVHNSSSSLHLKV